MRSVMRMDVVASALVKSIWLFLSQHARSAYEAAVDIHVHADHVRYCVDAMIHIEMSDHKFTYKQGN